MIAGSDMYGNKVDRSTGQPTTDSHVALCQRDTCRLYGCPGDGTISDMDSKVPLLYGTLDQHRVSAEVVNIIYEYMINPAAPTNAQQVRCNCNVRRRAHSW